MDHEFHAGVFSPMLLKLKGREASKPSCGVCTIKGPQEVIVRGRLQLGNRRAVFLVSPYILCDTYFANGVSPLNKF